MNDHIVLDGYKYAVLSRSWKRAPKTGKSVAATLNAALDVTFGPLTLFETSGEIVAPVTPKGSGWGTIATLRASLAKTQTLSYTDHYGLTSLAAVLDGEESSRSPMWDGPSNAWLVEVRMVSK